MQHQRRKCWKQTREWFYYKYNGMVQGYPQRMRNTTTTVNFYPWSSVNKLYCIDCIYAQLRNENLWYFKYEEEPNLSWFLYVCKLNDGWNTSLFRNCFLGWTLFIFLRSLDFCFRIHFICNTATLEEDPFFRVCLLLFSVGTAGPNRLKCYWWMYLDWIIGQS